MSLVSAARDEVVVNARLAAPILAPSFATWLANRNGRAIDCLAAIVEMQWVATTCYTSPRVLRWTTSRCGCCRLWTNMSKSRETAISVHRHAVASLETPLPAT